MRFAVASRTSGRSIDSLDDFLDDITHFSMDQLFNVIHESDLPFMHLGGLILSPFSDMILVEHEGKIIKALMLHDDRLDFINRKTFEEIFDKKR